MKERRRKLAVVGCTGLALTIYMFMQNAKSGVLCAAVLAGIVGVYFLSRIISRAYAREVADIEKQANENYEKRIKKQIDKFESWKAAVASGQRVTGAGISTLPEEEVYLGMDGAELYEVRLVGSRTVGMSGSLVEGFSVHSLNTDFLREQDNVDTGSVYLTSKRLIFIGADVNRIVDLSSLVKVDSSETIVSLTAQGRDDNMVLKNIEGVFFQLALRHLQQSMV